MVRQTVSKWERGLSVPDAEMLVTIGEVLDTPVSTLPGVLHALCIAIAAATTLVLIALASIGGSYLEWDFSNQEYAVAGTMLHRFEWIFARMAPIILAGSITGAVASRK